MGRKDKREDSCVFCLLSPKHLLFAELGGVTVCQDKDKEQTQPCILLHSREDNTKCGLAFFIKGCREMISLCQSLQQTKLNYAINL